MKKTYRTVIERSCMSNNDEFVLYTDQPITREIVSKMPSIPFDENKLVLSRPVFDIEIEDGLDIHKSYTDLHDEFQPEITRFFDSIFKLKDFIDLFKEISSFKEDKEKLINFIVYRYSCFYYDCMSGGLKQYDGALLLEIIKHFNIDENMELYPKQDGSYTVKDFVNDFSKHSPDLSIIKDKLDKNKALPSICSVFE